MKTYMLRLTERELWHLKNSYEASFTDPDSMNVHERSAGRKVDRAFMKAYREKKAAEETERWLTTPKSVDLT